MLLEQSKKFNKIFICEDGQHPILLKSYLAKKITIETMVILEKLVEYVKDFDKNIIYDQDLKKKNWFNIGGKSKVFYKAEDLKDLIIRFETSLISFFVELIMNS